MAAINPQSIYRLAATPPASKRAGPSTPQPDIDLDRHAHAFKEKYAAVDPQHQRNQQEVQRKYCAKEEVRNNERSLQLLLNNAINQLTQENPHFNFESLETLKARCEVNIQTILNFCHETKKELPILMIKTQLDFIERDLIKHGLIGKRFKFDLNLGGNSYKLSTFQFFSLRDDLDKLLSNQINNTSLDPSIFEQALDTASNKKLQLVDFQRLNRLIPDRIDNRELTALPWILSPAEHHAAVFILERLKPEQRPIDFDRRKNHIGDLSRNDFYSTLRKALKGDVSDELLPLKQFVGHFTHKSTKKNGELVNIGVENPIIKCGLYNSPLMAVGLLEDNLHLHHEGKSSSAHQSKAFINFFNQATQFFRSAFNNSPQRRVRTHEGIQQLVENIDNLPSGASPDTLIAQSRNLLEDDSQYLLHPGKVRYCNAQQSEDFCGNAFSDILCPQKSQVIFNNNDMRWHANYLRGFSHEQVIAATPLFNTQGNDSEAAARKKLISFIHLLSSKTDVVFDLRQNSDLSDQGSIDYCKDIPLNHPIQIFDEHGKPRFSLQKRSESKSTSTQHMNIIELDIYDHQLQQARAIKIYQYRGWKDFSAVDASKLNELANLFLSQVSNNQRVMLHCRAGVGRTGTLFCYARLFDEFFQKNQYINYIDANGNIEWVKLLERINEIITEGREDRGPVFVQTKEQYELICLAIAEEIKKAAKLSSNAPQIPNLNGHATRTRTPPPQVRSPQAENPTGESPLTLNPQPGVSRERSLRAETSLGATNRRDAQANIDRVGSAEVLPPTTSGHLPPPPAIHVDGNFVPINAHSVLLSTRSILGSTSENARSTDTTSLQAFSAQSPMQVQQARAMLLNAISHGSGVFQFVSPKEISEAAQEFVLTDWLEFVKNDLRDNNDPRLQVGNYRITKIEAIDNSGDSRVKQIRLSYISNNPLASDSSERTAVISSIALPMKKQAISSNDLQSAYNAFELHCAYSDHTCDINQTIASYSGYGRNAALIVYASIRKLVGQGLIRNAATLETAVNQAIELGRSQRGPWFLANNVQRAEVIKALQALLQQQ